MIELTTVPPFNRKATIGFISAMLALLALCIGFLPIPFTILICYPPGILFGIVSLVLDLNAQREIRMNGEGGRTLALIAVYVGGLVILAMSCMIMAGVIFLPRVFDRLLQTIDQLRP